MIKFKGGPADGVVLALKRAPNYMRVTKPAEGKFDALDQLSDTPLPGEALFAYKKVEDHGKVHVCGGKITGWYAVAVYQFIEAQPDKAVMIGTNSWREWCREQQRLDSNRKGKDGQSDA